MEDSVEFAEYRPGHLHLNLHINGHYDVTEDDVMNAEGLRTRDVKRCSSMRTKTKDLKFRYESMTSSLREGDVLDESATLNLLGLLAFRMEDLDSAIKHFGDVIESDAENVNAIQNIAHVYARKNEMETVKKYNAQVQSLLGRADEPASEQVINKRMAFSLSEQAFAHAYDVDLPHYDEKKKRLVTALDIYDRAFSIGASSISISERRGWYFIMIALFIRLDTLMTLSGETEQTRLPGFNRAVNLIKELQKSEIVYHKTLSWAYLGILLERKTAFATTPMAIHDCGYTGTESLDCYSKAIQLAEDETRVLNRLAKVFQLLGKHEFALCTATMVIESSDEIEVQLSGRQCRARVNTSIYMKDLHSCKMGSSSMPDRSLLKKAEDDLNPVLSQSPNLRVFMDMGQICYYMGVDAIKGSFVIDEEYINMALIYFSKALHCEMGRELPELHLMRGKCMRVKGEESNALECFKRAIEMDRDNSRDASAFRCLMETLVTWYSQGGAMKRETIVNEVDKWVEIALIKYDSDVIHRELRALSHAFTHEVAELCKGTIEAGKMRLAKTYFSILPPLIQDHSGGANGTL